MNQQDKLKNTLREYYDNKEVSFNDGEWEKASVMLSASRRKKRAVYVAIIFCVILFSLTCILFISNTSLESKDIHTMAQTRQQPVAPESQPTQSQASSARSLSTEPRLPDNTVHTTHTEPLPTLTEQKRNTTQQLPESALSPLIQTDAKQPTTKMQEAIVVKNQTVMQISNNNDPNINLPTQSEVSMNRSKRNTSSTMTIATEAAGIAVNEKTEQASATLNAPEDQRNTSSAMNVAIEEAGIAVNEKTEEASATLNAPEDHLPVQQNTLVTEAASTPTEFPQPPASDNKENDRDTHLSASKKHTATLTPLPDDNAKPVAVEGIDINTTDMDTVGPSSAKELMHEGVFYELGVVFNNGWKNPLRRDARGFSPLAGIGYLNRMSNAYALSFGFQYMQVNQLSNSSKTSRISSYTYGEQSKVTVVTPSTLHYLLLPLKFHYKVNQRNTIGLGVNFAYLLNIDAVVKTYDEKPGVTENYKTIRQGGYTEGFSWFDTQASIFYTRRIKGSLALQAEVFLGLIDIKQDQFFGIDQKEKNSGAKISLIYYPSKKKNR